MKFNPKRNTKYPSVSNPPDMMDPVVEEALHRKLVTNKQVADAWLKRKSMYRFGKFHPVWRWLAQQEGVDGEELFRIAAHEYDYKQLGKPITEMKSFLQRVVPCFSEEQWKAMLRVELIPVKRFSKQKHSLLWNFAANDPTSKAVHAVARQCVGVNYEIYQTDRKTLAALFAEVYLTKLELPRKPGRED